MRIISVTISNNVSNFQEQYLDEKHPKKWANEDCLNMQKSLISFPHVVCTKTRPLH